MKREGFLITEEKITIDYCKTIILKAAKHKDKRKAVKRVLENLDLFAKVFESFKTSSIFNE